MPGEEILSTAQPFSWQVPGRAKITFPVESARQEGGNRLVPHERPYRDGSRHDDTGSKAVRYTLTCSFFTGCEEPGVDGDNLYPALLDELIASFDVHETGTLTLPTRGERRCRAESYAREEGFGERDTAAVTLVFVEDNEDDITAVSFNSPSARSVAQTEAQQATFSLGASGVYDEDVVNLQELAAGLESIAAAPGDRLEELEAQGRSIDLACARVERAFTTTPGRASTEQESLLRAPGASLPARQLARLRDTSARALTERVSSEPRIVTRVYRRTVSLLTVGAELGQDIERLLQLNAKYENPLAIPAGKPIRVIQSVG